MRAMLRWAHADLKTHRGEALFLIAATAGVVASLLLATALFGYATNPWQRVFNRSHGAHVWLHTNRAAEPARLAEIDGVAAVAGPYDTVATTVASRGARAAVELRAGAARPPTTGRPLIVAGRWLDPDVPRGVVLDAVLAAALVAAPGDTLSLPGGGDATLTVLGIAETAEPRYRPGERPGTIWAPANTVHGTPGPAGRITGLRLTDPQDTEYAVQRAVTVLGAGAVTDVSPWQRARAEAQGDNRLLGQVLGLFGLAALGAAALAVFGAISTRVRGHLRDISVLKAIGFTPGQVVRIFLAQHLAYAALGAALAIVLAEAAGDLLPGRLGDAVDVWQGLPGHTAVLLGVPTAVVLLIGAATALAAWRAGRVPPVPAGSAVAPPAGRGLSAPARRALALPGMPPALVLGWHSAFSRGRHAAAGIARLALPLLLICVALGAWSTIARFDSRPDQMGMPAALTARPAEGVGDREARALLQRSPDVIAAHRGLEVAALVPGQTGTVTLRGLGGLQDPYPYSVVEGRPALGPDEAVAGQGLLDLLGVGMGDWVRVTVGGHPQVLHVVGRNLDPENGGRTISTSLDTLLENDPALQPTLYHLRLRPSADPHTVRSELLAASAGRLDIHEVADPGDRLAPLRAVVVGLIVVLALIGLAEVSTAIGATVREGERDVLSLKAMGLSPRQVTALAVTAVGCTALAAAAVATAVGVPLARWLIDHEGRTSGVGAGIAHAPSGVHLLLLTAGAVLGAMALAVLPAARAAHRRLADTLVCGA
ncbi:FtsX-like permease family protein [Streptomyces sp. NPDC006430]|uniref:FtsX-like permease family protein n=1 Tax=Streptomyces sp. NPDC006430 TaxID=3154299 RepID=UPI0033A879E4